MALNGLGFIVFTNVEEKVIWLEGDARLSDAPTWKLPFLGRLLKEKTEMTHRREPNLLRKVCSLLGPMLFAGALMACASETPSKDEAQNTAQEKQSLADRAEAALANGDHQGAYEEFSRALQEEPNDPRALIGIAEIYLAIGNPDKALPIFERIGREFPDRNATALQGEGIALAMLGRREAAQKKLLKAVKMDPALWRAWNAIAANYDAVQEWDNASASYQKAAAVNPLSAMIRNNQGMSLTMQGNYSEAEKALRGALELDSRSAVIRTNLRLVLARQGKYDEALAGLAKEQLPVMLNNVGYIAMMNGDYFKARELLSQALQTSPTYYENAANNLADLDYLGRALIKRTY